jgi:hypothetical protein
MDKNKLNDAFEKLTPDSAASERMLDNIQNRPEPETHPVKRYAAIAAACLMMVGMGFLMRQYLQMPQDGPPGVGAEGPSVTGVVDPSEGSLHTVFVPYHIESPAAADPAVLDSEYLMEITPEKLRETEFRIYKDMQTFESYLVRSSSDVHRLGAGFGGFGIISLEVSDDLSYMVYTYSFGSGIHRSHTAVCFLDGSGRSWESLPYWHHDMRLEPRHDDFWAVYHTQPVWESNDTASLSVDGPLLAILTVGAEGVWIEVMHEDGMGLVPPELDSSFMEEYDFIEHFSFGVAVVTKDGKWGAVDTEGNIAVPLIYDGLGICFSENEGLNFFKRDGKLGYVNTSGVEVVPPVYDYSFHQCGSSTAQSLFRDGLAMVERDGLFGFIDQTGSEVIPLIYDGAYPFYDGLGKVEINGEWVTINKEGEFVTD